MDMRVFQFLMIFFVKKFKWKINSFVDVKCQMLSLRFEVR
jgi:hypothetical protein